MKKFLALLLAASLTMALGVTSFASTNTTDIEIGDEPYLWEDHEMTDPGDLYENGATYYFPIFNLDIDYNDGESNITSVEDLSLYKLTSSAKLGGNAIESAELVRKKLNGSLDCGLEYGNAVFLAVKFKKRASYADIDVTYTLQAGKGTDASGNGGNTLRIKGVVYGDDEGTDEYQSIGVNDPDVSFDDVSGKIELDFGGGVEYRISLSQKQKDLYLDYYDYSFGTTFDKIQKAHPTANLDFHLFRGGTSSRTFNHAGKLYLPADETDFLYEIVNGNLVTIPDAHYSSYEIAFVIPTATLGYYIVSDRPLLGEASAKATSDTQVSSEPEAQQAFAPATSGQVLNPPTGAC